MGIVLTHYLWWSAKRRLGMNTKSLKLANKNIYIGPPEPTNRGSALVDGRAWGATRVNPNIRIRELPVFVNLLNRVLENSLERSVTITMKPHSHVVLGLLS